MQQPVALPEQTRSPQKNQIEPHTYSKFDSMFSLQASFWSDLFW